MSESGDYNPGPWSGHCFDSARAVYDAHVGRSYDDAAVKSVVRTDVLEPTISSKCTNPLIIIPDVTGSMGEWPAVMFSKLPYLEHEAKDYLGKDLEIAFGAVGDGYCDKYPAQMRRFDSGTNLKDRMLELVIEKGGGGQISETYELMALYCLHHVQMPNAIKPVLIMIGDEKPYMSIPADLAKKIVGVDVEKTLQTKRVFTQLRQRFSVYFIRKPYEVSGEDGMSSTDREIRATWVALLGEDRVVDLPTADRVVDVIFGILGLETGRYDDFQKEIEGRQTAEQVATVYKSLATIHKLPGDDKSGKTSGNSILKLPPGGGESQPLI